MTTPAVPPVVSDVPAVGGDSTRAIIVILLGVAVLYLLLRANPKEAAPAVEVKE